MKSVYMGLPNSRLTEVANNWTCVSCEGTNMYASIPSPYTSYRVNWGEYGGKVDY